LPAGVQRRAISTGHHGDVESQAEYFVFALAMARLLRVEGMLSRTESIDEFHLKLSRIEKELYEEFLETEEAEILAEMQQYFTEAKQKAGGIRFDNQSIWSRIKSTVDAWIANACADKHVNRELVRRADEAILHRVRNLMAKTIRESLGAR
jgi:hypothetical protein